METTLKEAISSCATNDNAKLVSFELSEHVLLAGATEFANSSTDFDETETIVTKIFEAMIVAMTYEEFQSLSELLRSHQPDS